MSNYLLWQKIIHRLFLGNIYFKKTLYKFEKIFFLKKDISDNLKISFENHIFITGLPRSGTTGLLNFLYSSKKFASLIYEDMPFILAPNLYSLIVKKKSLRKKERLHKDSLFYNLKSPEAFDEVFLSCFKKKILKKELIKFITLVLLKCKKKKYLSKNNYNYKRIKLILNTLPNSKILIPFRHPINQAISLYTQHLKFIDLQKKDPFILEYMNFLGHHEFGLNHKSWNKSFKYSNKGELNYWLEQWNLFYKKIIYENKNFQKVKFICYEDFTTSKIYKLQILDFVKINKHNSNINFLRHQNKIKKLPQSIDGNLLNANIKLYKTMKKMNNVN